MTEILWKAKFGYGDIISPLCYAYNESVRKQEEMNLVYLFEETRDHRYKLEDAETLTDRILFLNEHTFKEDAPFQVNVEFEYGLDLPESFNHTHYLDENTPLHNLRFSDTFRWNGSSGHIAVITSIRNKEPFSGSSAWKDPYQGEWRYHINDPLTKLIHYETPVREACEILQTCKFAITYHGSAAWLCKWMGVPMIVVSKKPSWSKTVFPWAYVTETLNIDKELAASQSLKQINQVEQDLKKYLTNESG